MTETLGFICSHTRALSLSVYSCVMIAGLLVMFIFREEEEEESIDNIAGVNLKVCIKIFFMN